MKGISIALTLGSFMTFDPAIIMSCILITIFFLTGKNVKSKKKQVDYL